MPLKSGKMTPQERIFTKAYAASGDAATAALKAGYARQDQGYVVARRSGVAEEVRKLALARLTSEALPIAVATLIEVMTDKNQRGSARNMAAKIVIDRTLGEKGGADGKEAHELTGEELARAIEDLEREAAARAKPVNPGVFD